MSKLKSAYSYEIETKQIPRWNKPFVDRAEAEKNWLDQNLFCRCASCGVVVTKDLRNSINELCCEPCIEYEQAERERANLMGK